MIEGLHDQKVKMRLVGNATKELAHREEDYPGGKYLIIMDIPAEDYRIYKNLRVEVEITD